jgi:DNA-binding GntR family transcriptional regulator
MRAVDDQTLALKVYTGVRQRILTGALRPGQPMSRRWIATEMRTSLLPASHALQRLELEGLLESKPRRGTRVRTPTLDDILDHFVVREALEKQVAMRAAHLASPHELTHLASLACEVDEMSAQVDAKRYTDLHRTFHQQVAACCHCDPLYEAVDQCHAFATLWLSQLPRPSAPNSSHQELVAAIASGDPITAADAVTQHLALGMARAMEALPPATAQTGSPAPFRRRRRR